MNNRYLAVLAASACISLASLTVDAQVNIMPMGDSVTSRGAAPESSYRYYLYADLTNAGYQFSDVGGPLAFVGNSSGCQDGAPAISWPQEAYEGGDGWTTSTGISDLSNANSKSPNIVLLDLGANDYDQGAAPTSTNLLEVQQNLETIIQGFQANSSVVILLAVPTPWVIADAPDPVQKKFMTGLGSAVTKAARDQKKAGVSVVVVNLASGFNPNPVNGDTVDGTHPNIKGEQQIARKFFNALRPVLRRMGVVPQRRPRG